MVKKSGYMKKYRARMPSSLKPAKAQWSTGHLGTRVPGTLGEAIGRKGNPIPITQAYAAANPYFSPAHKEYSQNCQRSVVAYELRRRGYDVVAAPTYKGDKLPRAAYRNPDGTTNSYWMGAFKGAKAVSVGAKRNASVRQNIEKTMASYGSGSRGIIRVRWKGSGGHVFNVENVNGKIRYMDAQTGKSVDIAKYLSATQPGRTQLVRTDNLRISERAKNSVVQRRR